MNYAPLVDVLDSFRHQGPVLIGLVAGFFLARLGSWLDARGQSKRERQRMFNGVLDELNSHDYQVELLERSPDELRPLRTVMWNQLGESGELWDMDQECLNHIVTYGELIDRYNHHLQEMEWLKREILDHPNKQLVDYVSRNRQKLLEMLKQIQQLKRETAFEIRWWMRGQGLLSRRRWRRWGKEKDKLAQSPASPATKVGV